VQVKDSTVTRYWAYVKQPNLLNGPYTLQMLTTKKKPMDWGQPERGEVKKGYILVVISASQHSYSDIAVNTMTLPVQ